MINWKGKKQLKLETIDISSHFSDKVTKVFKNKYLSTRPTSTISQLPWHGIGDWPYPKESFVVDDSGMRNQAGDKMK